MWSDLRELLGSHLLPAVWAGTTEAGPERGNEEKQRPAAVLSAPDKLPSWGKAAVPLWGPTSHPHIFTLLELSSTYLKLRSPKTFESGSDRTRDPTQITHCVSHPLSIRRCKPCVDPSTTGALHSQMLSLSLKASTEGDMEMGEENCAAAVTQLWKAGNSCAAWIGFMWRQTLHRFWYVSMRRIPPFM